MMQLESLVGFADLYGQVTGAMGVWWCHL